MQPVESVWVEVDIVMYSLFNIETARCLLDVMYSESHDRDLSIFLHHNFTKCLQKPFDLG